jgi:hypothetical protein
MLSGGNKIQKTKKTKFNKNRETYENPPMKNQKHHDKSMYRLLKQEKIMSYREVIKNRIIELEKKIQESETDRVALETLRSELIKLNMQDFEEDMREESGQQLLKG